MRRGEHYYVFTHIPKTAGSAVLQFVKDRMGCGSVECLACSKAMTSSGCIAHETSLSDGGAYASIQIAVAEPAWRCACEGCCRVVNACGHKGHRRRAQLAPAVKVAASAAAAGQGGGGGERMGRGEGEGEGEGETRTSSSASFAASTSPEVRLFAMFREPVARTLSNYRHAKRANGRGKWACCGLPMQLYREVNRRSGGRMDLEGFLSHAAVRNMATKMLAGLGPGDMRVDWEAERAGLGGAGRVFEYGSSQGKEGNGGGGEGIAPNKTLNAALAALEEMDFVGVQEEYGESLRQLSAWMGLGLDGLPLTAEDTAVLNSHGDAAQLTTMLRNGGRKIREMAREANVEDAIVYRRALEIFEEQKRRWPVPLAGAGGR